MDSLDLCNSIRMEFEGIIENKIPLDVFPAKLQDMVLALARQENYSIEYTMASLIAAASTAIGNAVNIAQRLAAESSVGRIYCTEAVRGEIDPCFKVGALGEMRLRGVEQPVGAFFLEGEKG